MSFLSERVRRGYSQGDVARLMGVDQSTVSLWESGTNKPRVNTLIKLAQIYGCTMEELLAEESDAPDSA